MRSRHASEIDVGVGKRVRMRRLMIKMSQAELAKSLGLTFQQVQKYEKGSSRISAGRMQEIAAVLKVPVAFLYDGVPIKAHSDKSTDLGLIERFLATKDGLALITAFAQLKDLKVRKSIVDLVKSLATERPLPKARR